MIRPWSPLNEISRLERSISSMFNDLWRGFSPRTLAESEFGGFPVDVLDEGENIVVRAELPGVEKDKIDLRCTENSLSISSEKSEDKRVKEGTWVVQESSFGKMVRTVRLDAPVDPSRAEASFSGGVLTVKLPKTGPSKRGHNIQIT
ncbi:MAG TPA: Hsp20/alpha crystallin family protein [Firmicutes bacterium]|nr:Hsp20/alpha crystallin family protein [Bacillota bacterium]